MPVVEAATIIRESRREDIQAIVEMGSRSIAEGPYKNELIDNPEVTTRLAKLLIGSPHAKVIVAERGGELIGIFAFIVFPHYFSGELTAGEIIWYVEPEAREGGPALQLWFEAVAVAHKLGAKRMQMTAPSEEVGKMYELRRYKKIEVLYQKEI